MEVEYRVPHHRILSKQDPPGQPTSLLGRCVLHHAHHRQPYLKTSEALTAVQPQEFPPRLLVVEQKNPKEKDEDAGGSLCCISSQLGERPAKE